MEQDIGGVVINFTRRPQCRHNSIIVDESLEQVICKICNERLNPFFVIKEMMKNSELWKRQKAEANLAREQAEKKTRTKCQHCGKMTKVKVHVKYDDVMLRALEDKE